MTCAARHTGPPPSVWVGGQPVGEPAGTDRHPEHLAACGKVRNSLPIIADL
jgi:hypothetical protein